MKTYWIVLPDCTSFKKHRAFFIKGGPNPGPEDSVPETRSRAPAKFYVTLWLQFVVWRNFCWQHQCVLALWAEKILKLNVFLCNFFLKHILFFMKISKIGATRCQILRLKCTKFDFRWGSAPDPAEGAHSAPPSPLAVFKGPTCKGREGKEEGKGRERKGRERKGREGKGGG